MKKIISIGFDIPGNSELYLPFSSKKSLLDADIVVFQPIISGYDIDYGGSPYRGKTLYSEVDSTDLLEDMERWKKELSIILNEGKTVFVLLKRYKEFFVHTGNKDVSGTGRSARVTRIVDRSDNYQFLPIEGLSLSISEGKTMKFVGASAFSSLWSELEAYLEYENFFNSSIGKAILTTKIGSKSVAAHIAVGNGNLVLLPVVSYDEKNFLKKRDDEYIWTKKALAFGGKFIKAIVEVDKVLGSSTSLTPPPLWVENDDYQTKKHSQLASKIKSVEEEVVNLEKDKMALIDEREEESVLSYLLYESGKTLEAAVIKALRIIGYKAEGLEEGDLEIDQIIMSPKGERFIAETEGKDKTAVNIDKLRQLSGNVQEDLERDEVSEPATGILFGNGYRLTEPTKREDQFTDKCQSTAKKFNYILIQTQDLFSIAKHISETGDQRYAKLCRQTLSQAMGKIVKFPPVPKLKTTKSK